RKGERAVDAAQGGDDALVHRAGHRLGRGRPFEDLQSDGMGTLGKSKSDGRDGRSGAVFNGQRESIFALLLEIEIAIAPGVELGRAAQRLTGADAASAFLGVMNDQNGKAMASLQRAKIGEEWRDLAAGVLIDAMQAHERIENEQARLQLANRLLEAQT